MRGNTLWQNFLSSFLGKHGRPRHRRGGRGRVLVQACAGPERLETRTLLSSTVTPGPEFQVNTTTVGSQRLVNGDSIAVNSTGNTVVVWRSEDGVHGQRYDASGSPVSGEFLVTSSNAAHASVAMDAEGDFVVTWEAGSSGTGFDVYGQRFSASGVALGGEFQVNTSSSQASRALPSVAMDALGGFIITWQNHHHNGVWWEINAQRYDASGSTIGGEFQVTTLAGSSSPSVAMNAAGRIVVVWSAYEPLSFGYSVYGQLYDVTGTAIGNEFKVNTTITGGGLSPNVSMDTTGNFVVAWMTGDIYGRRYDDSGTAMGNEFQVNTFTTGNQSAPSVAMNAAGNFVVTWHSDGQNGSNLSGVYGQRYSVLGAAVGGEFQVNESTARDHQYSSVAMDAAGNFFVVWESVVSGAFFDWDIYARRYEVDPSPPVVTRVLVSSTSWSTAFKDDYLGSTDGFYPVPTDGGQLRTLPWDIDQVRMVFDQDVTIAQNDLVITNGDPSPAPALNGFSYADNMATWTIDPVTADKLLLNLNDQTITNTAGQALDGEFVTGSGTTQSGDGSPGGVFRFRINVLAGDADGSEQVDSGDTVPIGDAFGSQPGDPNWDPFADLDGNGQVASGDITPIGAYFLNVLPVDDPPEHVFFV